MEYKLQSKLKEVIEKGYSLIRNDEMDYLNELGSLYDNSIEDEWEYVRIDRKYEELVNSHKETLKQLKIMDKIEIPNDTKIIAEEVFKDNKNLLSIYIPDTVEIIKESAFEGCISLKTLFIPKNVKIIEKNAFKGCSSLEKIVVDDDNLFFDSRNNCNSLIDKNNNCLIRGSNNSIIPDGIERIEDYAFSDLDKLSYIFIPESVKEFGKFVFINCNALVNITVSEQNPSFDSRDKCNAVIDSITNELLCACKNTIIPNSVSEISEYAFLGCQSIVYIKIPSSIKTISKYAFCDCKKLAYIKLPSTIKYIDEYAFTNCKNLMVVDFGNSYALIDETVFDGCSNLISTVNNSNITISERKSYYHQVKTKDIFTRKIYTTTEYYTPERLILKIPNLQNNINNDKYSYILIDNKYIFDFKINDKKIEFFEFNDCFKNKIIISLADYSFENCVSLKKLVIPDTVLFVGKRSFANCKLLKKVVLSNEIKSIEDYLFLKCINLKKVSISADLYRIGNYSFYGCKSLEEFDIFKTIIFIGKKAFSNCDNIHIYCSFSYKPKSWDDEWIDINSNVKWGCIGAYRFNIKLLNQEEIITCANPILRGKAFKYDSKKRDRVTYIDDDKPVEYMLHGEVKKGDTFNYRSQKPERDGLFCEVIFGPTKNYQCACGKTTLLSPGSNKVCSECGVEYTENKVRCERMGIIILVKPVVNPLFRLQNDKILSTLCGISGLDIKGLLNFNSALVIDENNSYSLKKGEIINKNSGYNLFCIEKLLKEGKALSGVEAIEYLIKKCNINELYDLYVKQLTLEQPEWKKCFIIERIKILKVLIDNNIKPELAILNIIAVTPPGIRDNYLDKSFEINSLYRKIISTNNWIKNNSHMPINHQNIYLQDLQKFVNDYYNNSVTYSGQKGILKKDFFVNIIKNGILIEEDDLSKLYLIKEELKGLGILVEDNYIRLERLK